VPAAVNPTAEVPVEPAALHVVSTSNSLPSTVKVELVLFAVPNSTETTSTVLPERTYVSETVPIPSV